jgi:hypothetical protein
VVRRMALGLSTVAALAAIAPAAHAAPSQLEVRCTAAGTVVAAPRAVDVRMGGAWLHVVNATSKRMSVTVTLGRDSGPITSRDVRPGVTGWMRFALAPGQWRIACIDRSDAEQDPPSSPGYRERLVRVTVSDPHGWYRPEALSCKQQVGSIADYPVGAEGIQDVSELPRFSLEAVEYARPGDVVGDAGYAVHPATARSYRVLRGDRVIGLVTWTDGGNGWLRNITVLCSPPPA